MLKALANQLRHLADTEGDVFRASVAKKMGGRTTEEQIGTLKEFIFLLPITLKQLNSYWNDNHTPSKAKQLSGLIISYIYQPDDFLPENSNGLFAYLDDAYVAVAAFLRVQDLYLRDWQNKTAEEIDLEKRARELIVAPKIVIPGEVAKIDSMLDSFMSGEIRSFEEFLEVKRN
ncbi:MAG: hypothetical protein V3W18_03795 [candidate division Zixibacteria bacterium]